VRHIISTDGIIFGLKRWHFAIMIMHSFPAFNYPVNKDISCLRIIACKLCRVHPVSPVCFSVALYLQTMGVHLDQYRSVLI
jgi:hypothetical protein